MIDDVDILLYQLALSADVKTLFPSQDGFVEDKAQFLAALCTRRAGKTNGLARRFIQTMRAHPRALCRYIALTRDSAKDIMWPVLEEFNERYNLKAQLYESSLTMLLPNGSRLKLYGADMKNFVRRLRGAKSPGTAIDEAQEFEPEHLENLVDNILTPAMADYSDGWLALTGTPGPLPMGPFYKITEEDAKGFSVHKWSLLDNPYLPDAKGFLEKLKKKNQWTNDHPTLRREWLGQWVLDLDSLLIKYNSDINNYADLPQAEWIYILGIDIGLRDSDALAIIGWNEKSQDIYLIEEVITAGQDITMLTDQINKLMTKYNPAKIVMDQGGLGAKIAEELRRRKALPILPADKKEKFQNVALLNEWLRLGKFKAKSGSRFATDSKRVQIDWEKTTPDRIVVKKAFHSDVIDAVLYAFKESPAYTYREPIVPPQYGTPEWAQQEAIRIEEAAEAHFAEEAEQLRMMKGF